MKNNHIIDRRENCTSPSENCTSLSENCTSPSENDTSPSENCTSPSENDISSFYDISETLEELPIVKRALSPEKYFLTTFKPIGILFNGNLPIGQEKKIGMTSEKDKRRGKLAYIVLMLNFDELGNGVKISIELTVYDKEVWNDSANLMKWSYDTSITSRMYLRIV